MDINGVGLSKVNDDRIGVLFEEPVLIGDGYGNIRCLLTVLE
jgi:hypothetical protein